MASKPVRRLHPCLDPRIVAQVVQHLSLGMPEPRASLRFCSLCLLTHPGPQTLGVSSVEPFLKSCWASSETSSSGPLSRSKGLAEIRSNWRQYPGWMRTELAALAVGHVRPVLSCIADAGNTKGAAPIQAAQRLTSCTFSTHDSDPTRSALCGLSPGRSRCKLRCRLHLQHTGQFRPSAEIAQRQRQPGSQIDRRLPFQ
jgi:hypothetical protein